MGGTIADNVGGFQGKHERRVRFLKLPLRLKPASQRVLKCCRRAIALGVSGDEILQLRARTSETEFRGQCTR